MRHLYTMVAIVTAIIVLTAQGATAQESIDQYDIYKSVVAEQQRIEQEKQTTSTIEQSSGNSTIQWRHNIRIGYGAPGLISTAVLDTSELVYTDVEPDPHLSTLSGIIHNYRQYEDVERMYANFFAEYSFAVKSWLTLGAKMTFAAYSRPIRDTLTDKLLYHDNSYSVGAIFNVRFEWLRRNIVQMYSGVGFGIAARFKYNDGIMVPMIDYTGIGIAVGRNFYGYAELGGGISGCARIGIGYRFN